MKDKIEKLVTEDEGDLQERIKKLVIQEEMRERREKRNNIVIKGCEEEERYARYRRKIC